MVKTSQNGIILINKQKINYWKDDVFMSKKVKNHEDLNNIDL